MKITLGKQHYIENFDFDKFIEEFNVKSYQEQRAFIESFDISTNPQWLDLKRGKLGASTASKFLADSQKVSAMKRTKKYQDGTEKEKSFMLAEIPLEEKLGETCKELAYKILAERRTKWSEPEANWSEKTSIKRGLIFEQFSSEIYEKLTGSKLVDVLFIERNDLFGFSPDKLVVDDEKVCVEIKNFEPPAFYKAISDMEKPETIAQIQMQIWIGGLDRVDCIYTSFEDNTFKVIRHFRDEEYMKKFERREKEFREYLDLLEEKLETEVIDLKK